MKQSGHLNHSEETGTGCPVTSKYGRTPPNKHGGVGRQQQQHYMVETYSSMGLVMALYVTKIVSFCFPHVVDVSALSICIVLRAFVVVISMCLLYVVWGREQS